jgi:hypothetical protein
LVVCVRARCDGDQADASECGHHSERIPRAALQGPTPVIAPPLKPKRPRAARLTNAREPAPTPVITAVVAGPTRTITAEAIAEIQHAAAGPELADLDRAVEALVKRYTCGSVIDAAWAASGRLHPWSKGGAA